MTDLAASLDRFVERLRARLAEGAKEYGQSSFTRPVGELIDEIEEELLDVAGWGLFAWIGVQRLRGRVDAIEEGGPDEPS